MRGRIAVAECQTVIEIEENPMATNEVEVWKDAAKAKAVTDLVDAQTRQMIAENSLGITEQMQAEAHREHERKLELRKLANEHEIDKMSTVDVAVAAKETQALATQRHDAATSLQKGWIKGLVWGTPIGWAIGFGSGIALGLFI